MAGGLAAALAGRAHLDSRKHGQQGGGCDSEWTDTVTVHAEGGRSHAPAIHACGSSLLGHRLSSLGRSRVAHAADGAARSAWPSKPSFCSSFRCRRFGGDVSQRVSLSSDCLLDGEAYAIPRRSCSRPSSNCGGNQRRCASGKSYTIRIASMRPRTPRTRETVGATWRNWPPINRKRVAPYGR